MILETGGTWTILGVETRLDEKVGLFFVCREQGLVRNESGRLKRVHFVFDFVSADRPRAEIELFFERCVARYEPSGVSRTLARLARKRRLKLPPNLRVINLEALS